MMLKQAAFGFAAVMAGALGVSLLLSDFVAGEVTARRMLLAGVFFFLAGLGFGSLNRRYWPAAGLIAWGGVLATIAGLTRQHAGVLQAMAMLGLTLGMALAGGFAGARLAIAAVHRRSFPRHTPNR